MTDTIVIPNGRIVFETTPRPVEQTGRYETSISIDPATAQKVQDAFNVAVDEMIVQETLRAIHGHSAAHYMADYVAMDLEARNRADEAVTVWQAVRGDTGNRKERRAKRAERRRKRIF